METDRRLIEIVNKVSKLFKTEKYNIIDIIKQRDITAGAFKGKYDLRLTPFWETIYYAFDDPKVREISIMASAQVGKTEFINSLVYYLIKYKPDPIIIIQPTEDMARQYVKNKLDSVFDQLGELILNNRVNDSVTYKKFIGGYIAIVSSRSSNALAQRTAKIIISDDCDRFEQNVGGEGSPIMLAEKRAVTYQDRKLLRVSTPTIKGRSHIEKYYNDGSKSIYKVTCPHCNNYIPLNIENLDCEKDLDIYGNVVEYYYDTTTYVCPICRNGISEIFKYDMLSNGKWFDSVENPSHKSYYLNELYSNFVSWKDILKNYHKCKDDINQYRTFVNTTLGLPFEDYIEAEDYYNHIQYHGFYTPENPLVPDGKIVISFDVQDDRIEYLINLYDDNNIYVLEYGKLFKTLDDPTTQNDIYKLLCKQFMSTTNNILIPFIGYIDAGGHYTGKVFELCRKINKLIPIFGKAGDRVLNTYRVSKTTATAFMVVGVDTAKDIIFSKLRNSGSDLYNIYFNRAFCDKYFFDGLFSERKIFEYERGISKAKYVKTKLHNEPLDLMVYNYAASEYIKNYSVVLNNSQNSNNQNLRTNYYSNNKLKVYSFGR